MEENIQTPEVDTAPQDQPEGEATAAAGTTQEAETATDTTPEAGEADNVQQPITIPIQYKHEARELTLDEIPAGKVKDYLMASAACLFSSLGENRSRSSLEKRWAALS